MARFSLAALSRAQFGSNLGLGLLGSRALRRQIPAVEAIHMMIICYRGPKKQMQHLYTETRKLLAEYTCLSSVNTYIHGHITYRGEGLPQI